MAPTRKSKRLSSQEVKRLTRVSRLFKLRYLRHDIIEAVEMYAAVHGIDGVEWAIYHLIANNFEIKSHLKHIKETRKRLEKEKEGGKIIA